MTKTKVKPKKVVFHNKIPKPVGFGGHYFKSKVECTTEGKRRISKYKVGQTLSINDTKFFKEMFKLHPDYEDKLGCGIASIRYDTDKEYGTNCLFIVRHDGSEIDISWIGSLQLPKTKHDVQSAFRQAVAGDVNVFKAGLVLRGARCWVSDAKLGYGNCRVAYSTDLTFNELVDEFLDIIDYDFREVALVKPRTKDLEVKPCLMLADEWLIRMWQVYHKEMAEMVLVSTDENIRIKRKVWA